MAAMYMLFFFLRPNCYIYADRSKLKQHSESPDFILLGSVIQSQLPANVESALLQQVMNLTPEQLSSLPPEQQQQVIQLQMMLRRDQQQVT